MLLSVAKSLLHPPKTVVANFLMGFATNILDTPYTFQSLYCVYAILSSRKEGLLPITSYLTLPTPKIPHFLGDSLFREDSL